MIFFEVLVTTSFISFICYKSVCIADNDIETIENDSEGGSSTEQVQESTFQIPEEKWTSNSLKDIAYYLRNYKFNEWDRRYYADKSSHSAGFFGSFPIPSLRSLHWKVFENCNSNFYKCIIYLQSIITTAPFTRRDDTTIFLNENSISNENESIKTFDIECKTASLNSEKSGLPFDSPLEKFQWRTTAAYYMCWYTMLGTPALAMLGESCDNFANCIEPTYGAYNRDIRSDDRLSFACAIYSFCPDPCCPVKNLQSITQCNELETNPCYSENTDNEPSDRTCRMDRKDNQNFNDIVGNRWNVSCHCDENGFVWKSRFGTCVDKNECSTGYHTCNNVTEDCLNLPGSFHCICKWGFILDEDKKTCIESNIGKTSDVSYYGQRYTLMDSLKSILNLFGLAE